jgi:protein-tyrosine phosphatase
LHVLFVCTGNICRSPIAERFAVAEAARAGSTGFQASSAGIRAVIGSPIEPHAANVIEKLGGAVDSFAARQLTPRIAADADLILTMTRAHRDRVLEVAPSRLHRTFTLGEAAQLLTRHHVDDVSGMSRMRAHLNPQEIADVPDPIGRDADFFSTVGAQIVDQLTPLFELFFR